MVAILNYYFVYYEVQVFVYYDETPYTAWLEKIDLKELRPPQTTTYKQLYARRYERQLFVRWV